MESQYQDQQQSGSPPQQSRHQQQGQLSQLSQLSQQPPSHRGGKRPGRPRGSSRAGRPSSSSGNHHSYNDPPASMTNIINFGNSPASIYARTPVNRGGGKTTLSHPHPHPHPHSHSHSHASSHAPSSSPPLTDMSSPATPSMDFGPHSERTPKQGLGHSFTFSTPQPNPGKNTGRKRARTLEYPTDSGNADDDAKVKGGHSLRKRARIDYAQMNEDDDHTHTHPTEGPLEITVSGARAVRKRKSVMDPNSEEPEEQPQPPPAVAQKKRARADKQRTASPVPQRRPYTKRKSTAPSVPVEEPLPEQQQSSDTELKDTIEVGAPLAMQFTSSSSNGQPSETASNISGQSPSHNGNIQQVVASQNQVASPPAIRTETEATVYSREGTSSAQPIEGDSLVEHVTEQAPLPVIVHSPKNDLEGAQEKIENPSSNQTSSVNQEQEQLQAPPPIVSSANVSGTAEVSDSTKVLEADIKTPKQLEASQTLQINSLVDSQQHSQPAPQPSSQESVDSDATEIVPPTLIKPPVASPEPEQPTSQPTRLALRKSKQPAPALESQPQEETEEAQDSQKPSLRPRRRLNRIAENSAAADEEIPQSPKEKPTSASKKVDGRLKAANRSAPAQEIPQPTSPDTPKKRGPGRPPKIRQSIEQDPPKPKERRASRTAARMEQPRPMRSHPPRDFSFLTAYLDAPEMYPETSQDSGVPTPMETPTLQASDAADEQTEDVGSLAPEKESGSQDPVPGPEGDVGSNAPSPAAVFDIPTPAAESAAPSRNPSPEPVVESMRKPKPRKQYSFPRIRSPSEFASILDDHKKLSDEELFSILEVTCKTLSNWQEEWKTQRLVTEDEDNAVRRRAHDAALMAREARDLAKTNGAVTMEKRDFEVKGIRADRTYENRHLYPQSNPEAYERVQDQVAAQALGFEWDPRPSMIARQDPIAQRDGLQNTRLRNRPKLSQRAAEAAGDEPVGVVPGKRTRKPRLLSDESKDVSRAATPVEPVKPPRRRRRRRNSAGELVDSDNEGGTQQPEVAQPVPPPVQEGPPKKKRGPKPKAVKEAEARAAAEREAAEKAAQQAAAAADNPQDGMDVDQPTTRKRRRGAAAAVVSEIQPQDIPTASIEDAQPQGSSTQREAAEPAPKRRRGRKPKVEAPTTAFYSTASSAPTNDGIITPTEEVVRPSTSSSTSSMRTVGSSYSFRTRPRKNYSEMADPIKDVLAEPRPKRGRKPKNQHQDLEPTSYPSNLVPASFTDGAHLRPPPHGYQPQSASVLALPNNNSFINLTGGGPGPGPGPLLAPSPLRPGPGSAPPPPSVGANPFSAPINHPVDPVPPPQPAPSPARRKPFKIKLINSKNRTQSATPQPTGAPPQAQAPPHHRQPYAQAPAPLQPPSNFHGHTGYESHLFGGHPASHPPASIAGSGPGQVMFPVNFSPGSMSMPPALSIAGPPSSLHHMPGGRLGSLPPDTSSAGATPVPSSAASSNGGASGPAGDEALSEKDYASMTKSEKMSASMKARWANGSMRQAVNKRKETLARKKQKQTDDKTTTPTPQPESAPPEERPRVPESPNLPPQTASAIPEPVPQQPQQQQQQQQQPPHGFGGLLHLVGGHDGQHGPPPGGVVLPPPQSISGPLYHDQEYQPPRPPVRRESLSQNPFLDNGYADLHPRLPFSNADLEEIRGRREYELGRGWGPGPQG